MKIVSKEKSNLIDRTELVAEFPHEGKATPSNNEIRKAISTEFKTKEELIVVKLIDTKFGENTSIAGIYIYDNLEELKKLEKYVPPKEEPKEEKKIEEQPKEKASEEKIEENGKKESKEQTTE